MPAEMLRRMKERTAGLRASALGDAIGIGWFLRDVNGVRTVGHAGSANGQFAELLTVPERNFAVVALSNAGPGGIRFNKAAVRWALQTYLGMTDRDPEPLPYDDLGAQEVVGTYQNDYMTLTIHTDGHGLRLDVRIKPEIRAAAKTEPPADHAPADIGLVAWGRGRVRRHKRRSPRARRLVHPQRERRDRGRRYGWSIVQAGSDSLGVRGKAPSSRRPWLRTLVRWPAEIMEREWPWKRYGNRGRGFLAG